MRATLTPMTTLTAVLGDITTQPVDAIVNAANNAMRGGGGVDGAIHRAGGPAVLRDCIARFPEGLATGDAGWTTGGDLPARWVIHTVGPNYAAGQRDRALLESCYRRALAVADELGARSVAVPLIRAGVYGWPLSDAVAVAVRTIAATPTRVVDARLVTPTQRILEELQDALAAETPLRILQGVRVLHQRGYHRVRVRPSVSPSGMHWRATLTAPGQSHSVLRYTTGGATAFAGGEVTLSTSPDAVADLILASWPDLRPTGDDPAYVAWYAELLARAEAAGRLPIAAADYFDDAAGWEIGWGSGMRYPHPPGDA